MTELKEKTMSSKLIYRGKILSVHLDEVQFPDGQSGTREVVQLSDAVAIVALTDEMELLMVNQYRYPVGKVLLEIPAGKLEKDEQPLNCAQRELEEETGYRADNWEQLGSFYVSPGFCSEKITLFKASGLSKHQTKQDADEYIENTKMPLQDALKLIRHGDIEDAKTMIGLLMLEKMMGCESVGG